MTAFETSLIEELEPELNQENSSTILSSAELASSHWHPKYIRLTHFAPFSDCDGIATQMTFKTVATGLEKFMAKLGKRNIELV